MNNQMINVLVNHVGLFSYTTVSSTIITTVHNNHIKMTIAGLGCGGRLQYWTHSKLKKL